MPSASRKLCPQVSLRSEVYLLGFLPEDWDEAAPYGRRIWCHEELLVGRAWDGALGGRSTLSQVCWSISQVDRDETDGVQW